MQLTLIDKPGEDQWSEFRENCLLGPGDMDHLMDFQDPHPAVKFSVEKKME